MINIQPLGIRREQLGEVFGSDKLAEEMVKAQWLKPVVERHKLILFDYADCVKAFGRLKKEQPARIVR